MITLYEASNLLATIRAHHGDARFGEEDVRMFQAELMRSMTVGEARAAIVEYYSRPHDRWCGAGDINAIVRKHRAATRPSEAQVNRECEKLGLTADQSWLYRRYRITGQTPADARQHALTAANPLALPTAKPKPKREGPGFNPCMGVSLRQVIGHE